MAGEQKEHKAKEKPRERKTKAFKPGRYCPKCGPGSKLAEHKDRLACGKCGYMERR